MSFPPKEISVLTLEPVTMSYGNGAAQGNNQCNFNLLAGLEYDPTAIPFAARQNEDGGSEQDCLTPHTASNTAFDLQPSTTVASPTQTQLHPDIALDLQQPGSRLYFAKQLTDGVTQVFPNNLDHIPYRHQDACITHAEFLLANSPIHPPHQPPPHHVQPTVINYVGRDCFLQAAPAVGQTAAANDEPFLDPNLLSHKTVSEAPPCNVQTSSGSQLNAQAPAFHPHQPTRVFEHPAAQDITWDASTCNFLQGNGVYEHNIPAHIPAIILSGPENNEYSGGAPEQTITPYCSRGLALSQGAFTQPSTYTEAIDIGSHFWGEFSSPPSTSAYSPLFTSISWPGSQHEYPISNPTPSTFSGPSRRDAVPLSRSPSARTSASHETYESGPRRGRRKGPMDRRKNELAQISRSRKLVCAICKFRKVQCDRKEIRGICGECKKSGKPCVSHFFFRDLSDLPEFHFGQFLINSAVIPDMLKPLLSHTVDFTRIQSCLDMFSPTHNIRIKGDGGVWFDLDLAACQQRWAEEKVEYDTWGCPCTVDDFVTSKQRWQDIKRWRDLLVVSSPHQENWGDLVEALNVLDKMSGCMTYFLIPKSEMAGPAIGYETLDLQNNSHEILIFVAMLTFERVRHQMQLGAYSALERRLSRGFPHSVRAAENAKTVEILGRILLSLRRRIATCKATRVWKLFNCGPLAKYLDEWDWGREENFEPPAVRRVVVFCFQLYVHFIERYSKMSPDAKQSYRQDGPKFIIHPYTRIVTREYPPTDTDGSKDEFNFWMAEADWPFRLPP